MHYPRDAAAPGQIAGGFQDAHEVGAGRRAASSGGGFVERSAGRGPFRSVKHR